VEQEQLWENLVGRLKGVKTVDLGALVIKEALKRAGLRPAMNDLLKSCRPTPWAILK